MPLAARKARVEESMSAKFVIGKSNAHETEVVGLRCQGEMRHTTGMVQWDCLGDKGAQNVSWTSMIVWGRFVEGLWEGIRDRCAGSRLNRSLQDRIFIEGGWASGRSNANGAGS